MWATPTVAIALVFVLFPEPGQFAETATDSGKRLTRNNALFVAQSILPPSPDAPGGGNPLQGLGRPDDTGPSRVDQFLPPGTIDTSAPVEQESKIPGADGKAPAGGPAKSKEAIETLPTPATANLPPNPDTQAHSSNPAPSLPTRPQTPLGDILSALDRKQFPIALVKLNELKEAEPDNLKARYLLAITLVYLRQNLKAEKEYRFVIEHSTDPHLSQLARAGLLKIMPSGNHSP